MRQGNLPKTAVLQQAQIALIQQKPVSTSPRTIVQRLQSNRPDTPDPEALSHPYYWAPFILIGNGL